MHIQRFVCVIIAVGASTVMSGCSVGNHPTGSFVSNSIGSSGMFAGSSNSAVTERWLRSDPRTKTVTLQIVAGLHGGKNLNGFRNGDMTVAVPPGWIVQVRFTNDDPEQRHSLRIIPFNAQTVHPRSTDALAATPHAEEGLRQGQSTSFRFVAREPGRFALVCGVPHANPGMWDALVVSSDVPSPRIFTNFKSK